MSAIADHSGVGKPTIYLRWANRRELMVAAVADLRAPVTTDFTSSARDDLYTSLVDDSELLVTGPEARFLRSVLFESVSDPDLAQELERSILEPRRERLVAILRRGAEEGQLRVDVAPDALADLLTGPLLQAMVVGSGNVEPEALRAHVDVIVERDRRGGLGLSSVRSSGVFGAGSERSSSGIFRALGVSELWAFRSSGRFGALGVSELWASGL